jgi:hypothetical protein
VNMHFVAADAVGDGERMNTWVAIKLSCRYTLHGFHTAAKRHIGPWQIETFRAHRLKVFYPAVMLVARLLCPAKLHS